MQLGVFKSGVFALDVGGSSVVALHMTGDATGLKLRACYEWPLPEGLVVDGEIVDGDLFARELRAFVGQHKLRGRAVHLAVSNQKVIVRNIDMPEMTDEELRGAIEFQAQDYIPIPVDEVVLDFQVISKHLGADGAGRQEVLLVAAQRTMIDVFLRSMRQAGLKVAGIDVASLALVRALAPPSSFLPEGDEAVHCRGIVDVASSVTTLVVAVDRVPKFTRIINFSSYRFPRSLGELRRIPFDDAQTMAQRVGLPGPLPADDELYSEMVVSETRSQLAQIAAELTDEIRRSFDYYQGQENAAPVQELVLSGLGALVRNLDAHVAEALDIPVSIGNPLTRISHNLSGVADESLAFLATYLAVAIGLAIPEED